MQIIRCQNILRFLRLDLTNKKANYLLLFIILITNLLVFANALCHDTHIGYDTDDHLKYVTILSQWRLPSFEETREFFKPPLPYFVPAILCRYFPFTTLQVAKISQFINLILSILISIYLLKICEVLYPKNGHFKILCVFLWGMLPVFYKTFAFSVRSETWLTFFTLIAIYKLIQVYAFNKLEIRHFCWLGFIFGLMLLTSQWSFFLIAGILFFIGMHLLKQGKINSKHIISIVTVLLIASLMSGWFYFSLYQRFGTIKAFNRTPAKSFSFSNQPRNFYFSLGFPMLFTDPIRDSFPNQFWPKFYSEFWGDYESYFLVYSKDIQNKTYLSPIEVFKIKYTNPFVRIETNRNHINKYLGRVNRVSLFPTLVLFLGLCWGFLSLIKNFALKGDWMNDTIYSLLTLIIGFSILGYFWFLIMYPNLTNGDTIKATYLIHIYPLIIILAAEFLTMIKKKTCCAYSLIIGLLIIIYIHNFPAYITHYSIFSLH